MNSSDVVVVWRFRLALVFYFLITEPSGATTNHTLWLF